jgi:3-oxoadipate enol-lactonase
MQAKETQNKTQINNISINYSDRGPKNSLNLLFIHGFPFNKNMWDKQAELLSKEYRVITYDVRGHGESDFGNEDFSIELFVKDLIELLNYLKIDKAVLIGLSMGGYIALKAVLDFPNRFEALVISNSHCFADTDVAREKRVKSIQLIQTEGLKKYADMSVQNLFSEESFVSRIEEIEFIREMILNTSRQSIQKTLEALANREETCSRLDEIKIPALILHGTEDKITSRDASQILHKKIKNSVLQFIDHAAHMSNLENPDEFNKQLSRFLGLFKSYTQV